MLANLLLPDGKTTSVYYHVWGEENASRTIFCAHGLTRNGMDFECLALALVKQGFRVIAPDMPGRGKSAWLADSAQYNNLINANLCVQLLVQLGIKKVDWVGTSMGGIIALMIANQAPGLIEKLVLNDVGCMITASALARIGEYVGHSPHFANFEEAEIILKTRTITFAIPPEHWQRFAEHSIEKIDGYYRIAYDPAIALAFGAPEMAKDIELWPLWEAVKKIPTLLIRGEQSDLLTEETAKTMQATHPRLTRFNCAGAGHAPSLTSDPEIAAIASFLQYDAAVI